VQRRPAAFRESLGLAILASSLSARFDDRPAIQNRIDTFRADHFGRVGPKTKGGQQFFQGRDGALNASEVNGRRRQRPGNLIEPQSGFNRRGVLLLTNGSKAPLFRHGQVKPILFAFPAHAAGTPRVRSVAPARAASSVSSASGTRRQRRGAARCESIA